MELHIKSTSLDNDMYLLTLSGKMNALTVSDLKNLLKKLIPESTVRIIIDLKEVNFIDSSGLSTLISTLKNTREQGGFLRLVHIQPQVKQVFELTMLDHVFQMYKTVDEAIRA